MGQKLWVSGPEDFLGPTVRDMFVRELRAMASDMAVRGESYSSSLEKAATVDDRIELVDARAALAAWPSESTRK